MHRVQKGSHRLHLSGLRARARRGLNGCVALAALLFAGCCAHKPAHEHGQGHHKRFDDAEQWAKVFDDPERDAWQRPDLVLAELALKKDARVADLGAGTGYFAVRMARVATEGKVYGVDIEPDMVRYLDARAKKENLPNLVGVISTPDDPRIPEAVDVVLVVDTYHHIDARPAYFAKVAEKLKPGGRLVIIDFTKESPHGPPAEMRMPSEQVTEELKQAGFGLKRSPALLPNQYFLVYARG